MATKLPNVSSQYGAPMGRRSYPLGLPNKLRLERVRLDSGGYDNGGAYWGHGDPLYMASGADGEGPEYFRAKSRDDAKAILRNDHPDVKFYR